MLKRSINLILAGAVLLFLAAAIAPQRKSHARGIDGYAWLSWSKESRQLYVLAFLEGYHRGAVEGCLAADEIAKPRWTIAEINACYDKQMRFTRGVDGLTSDMTQFYEQYPEDRTLELDTLVRQFSDQRRRSPKEIHTLLQSKQPL